MNQKIDKNLFSTQILSNKKLHCIVFGTDLINLKSELKKVLGANSIIFEFKFLNAIEVVASQSQIVELSNLFCVDFVSSVQTASILLFKAKQDLKINDLHKANILGQGTNVAVIDTGCRMHTDFVLGQNRIIFFKDFLNDKKVPYDDNGHGTFVAGILAGSGVFDGKKFCGVAPKSKLVILKALDQNGETKGTTILKAMQWVLDNAKKFDIKVVCMSFGSAPLEQNDPLAEGARILWENGITVVCAAGNDGPSQNTIKSPGICPNVITVGSADKLDTSKPVKVAPFSSRGPAFDFVKPDLIAPGVEIVSTSATKNYEKMSGTSVSTPFVAGLCALMLSKNKNLDPNMLKFLLTQTASKVEGKPNDFGSGMINPYNLFE